MGAHNLGYLKIMGKNNGFLGGFMVTDDSGIPLEFKYTEPVVPTKIQEVIYGKALKKYIKEDVIIKSLLKEIRTIPSIIIVDDPSEIMGKDKIGKFPAVAVQKTSLPQLSSPGETQRVKDKEIIFQPFQDVTPIRIVFGVADPELQEKILLIIEEISPKMDIVEPLERVEKALNLVWEKKD